MFLRGVVRDVVVVALRAPRESLLIAGDFPEVLSRRLLLLPGRGGDPVFFPGGDFILLRSESKSETVATKMAMTMLMFVLQIN